MWEIILRIIAVLIILVGVIIIYDSRLLTKRFFGFGDQNEATSRIKDSRINNYTYRISNIIF